MKNHVIVAGKLLQANKKFSNLKHSQQNDIRVWIANAYKEVKGSGSSGNHQELKSEVVCMVMEKIRERDIWIPEREISREYNSMARKLHAQYNTEKERK